MADAAASEHMDSDSGPSSNWFEVGRSQKTKKSNRKRQKKDNTENITRSETEDEHILTPIDKLNKKSKTEIKATTLPPLQGILVSRGAVPKMKYNCEQTTAIGDNEKTTTNNNAKTNKDNDERSTVNDTELKKTNNDIDKVMYDIHHKGDFCVLIDTSKSPVCNNEEMKNGLYFWEKIKDFGIQGLKNIKALGRSLYKLFFESHRHANECLDNTKLTKNIMRPFIPRNFIETAGVARQIPISFTDNDILANIKSNIKVNSVYRITKRDPDNREKFIPTTTIKICFQGNDLPETIDLFYTKIKINHYIPRIRQCYNCGRLGHTKLGCRAKNRCILCGREEGCNSRCVNTNNCILCNEIGHNSLQRNACRVWQKEKTIMEVMTIKKLSKREAIETYNLNSNNLQSSMWRCNSRRWTTSICKSTTFPNPNHPPEYQICILGYRKRAFTFNSLCDFQYLPLYKDPHKIENLTFNLSNIVPQSVTDTHFYSKKDVPLLSLPQLFARVDTNNTTIFRGDQQDEDQHDVLGVVQKTSYDNRDVVAFNMTDTFPERPDIQTVKRMRVKYVSDEQLQKVKSLFDECPIWTRIALLYESAVSNEKLKCIIPSLSYYFSSGPWRTLYVRYGYDPRKDFKSRYYQTFDYRLRFRSGVSEFVANKKSQQKKLNENTYELNELCQDINYPYFDENKLPRSRQCILRYCDIHMPKVQEMIEKIPSPRTGAICNEKTGWLPAVFDTQVRQVMSNAIKELLRNHYRKEQIHAEFGSADDNVEDGESDVIFEDNLDNSDISKEIFDE